jgi:uncharacterized coiled-coil protein SlyX
MKCDELEKFDAASNADLSAGYDHRYAYEADEVDAAIAELKARIADLEGLNHDLCQRVTENDGIRQHWEEIEQTRAENERLKQKLESVQASMYADVVDANMENRRLRRALWIARAKRAIDKISWFKLWNASISTMNPEDGARQEFDKWKKALGKFLKKAEEYK